MNPADILRSARSSGYGSGPEKGSRSFPLMEGEDIPEGPCCVKVYGQAQDGKFMIDRIEPEYEGDTVRVKNESQISPS